MIAAIHDTTLGPEARSGFRTNMFVMATVYAGEASAPVRIRNLSPTGALIEGAHIPPLAAKVSLRRGTLEAAGEVVWSTGGRAGIRFDALANVGHWLPGGEALHRQEQVDAIFQEIQGSKDQLAPSLEPGPSGVTYEEIFEVKDLLEALAEALADDDHVIARYGLRLQSLDLAAQMLGKLAPEPS